MNRKMKVAQILQARFGVVSLMELDKNKLPVKGAPIVRIQFSNSAEAAFFEHGAEYNVSFTKTDSNVNKEKSTEGVEKSSAQKSSGNKTTVKKRK